MAPVCRWRLTAATTGKNAEKSPANSKFAGLLVSRIPLARTAEQMAAFAKQQAAAFRHQTLADAPFFDATRREFVYRVALEASNLFPGAVQSQLVEEIPNLFDPFIWPNQQRLCGGFQSQKFGFKSLELRVLLNLRRIFLQRWMRFEIYNLAAKNGAECGAFQVEFAQPRPFVPGRRIFEKSSAKMSHAVSLPGFILRTLSILALTLRNAPRPKTGIISKTGTVFKDFHDQ